MPIFKFYSIVCLYNTCWWYKGERLKKKIPKKIKSGKGILCFIVEMQQKAEVFPIKMKWFE